MKNSLMLRHPEAVAPYEMTGAKYRIMDAGEQLFAEFGFNGVSLRKIVATAGENLGAIPYYFSTKEALFKEIIFRRAEPLRNERRVLLEELAARPTTAQIEEVLWALLEPAFRTNRDNEHYRRLLGRAMTDPSPTVKKLMKEIFTLDFITVPSALRKCFGQIDDKEFYWKLNCFYGVMIFIQADTGKIQSIAGDEFDTSQPEAALKYVIPFLAAGMRASGEFKPPFQPSTK